MADVQTVFGSIGSIIEQTTSSILKIQQAQAGRYNANRLPGEPLEPVEADTSQETLAIVALVGVIAFLVYLVWKEGVK